MLKSRISLPLLPSEFAEHSITPLIQSRIHQVYHSKSYSLPSYLSASCPILQRYQNLMDRYLHQSDTGSDVTLSDDCQSFLNEFSNYQSFPKVTEIICTCGIPGIRHLPYIFLVDFLIHRSFPLLFQACLQPSQWLLLRIQQQRDHFRADGDVLLDPYWVFELCIETIEVCVDELLKVGSRNENEVAELRSQSFSTVIQMVKDYRKQNFFIFTDFTPLPVSLRFGKLFLDRHYDFIPSLSHISFNLLWMVPLAIPSFLTTEIEVNSDLVQVHKNLKLFLKYLFRSPFLCSEDLFWMQIVCILTSALDLYYNSYEAMETSLNDCVSVFRSDPLMLSWYVPFVTSLKGMRPSPDFAKKLETEWMGRELYLKREMIRLVVCTNTRLNDFNWLRCLEINGIG